MLEKPRMTLKELLDTSYDSYVIPSILFDGDPVNRLSIQALLAYGILSDWTQCSPQGDLPQSIETDLARILNIKPKKTKRLLNELMEHNLLQPNSNGYRVRTQVSII